MADLQNLLRQTILSPRGATRLLLALKSAIAVTLAWWIGSILPGAIDDYSYYAPLGAIISMTPTVMGSLRTSAQTVIALALGISIAWLVIAAGAMGPLGVAVAVGVGVLFASIRKLGSGADYIPIAALFVLLIGGTEPDNYSLGYLAQMATGMAIGMVVNFAIVPPLYVQLPAARISEVRTTIADVIEDIGHALVESWPPAHPGWAERMDSLNAAVSAAEPVIEDARESQRINPRARRHPHDLRRDLDDLKALERLVPQVVDIGEAISGVIWQQPVPVGLPNELLQPVSDSLIETAHLIRAWDARDNQEEAASAANLALTNLVKQARHPASRDEPTEAISAIILSLRRMHTVLQSRLTTRH